MNTTKAFLPAYSQNSRSLISDHNSRTAIEMRPKELIRVYREIERGLWLCFFLFYFLHKRKIIKQEISSVSLRVDEKYSGNVFKGHCFVKAHRTKY